MYSYNPYLVVLLQNLPTIIYFKKISYIVNLKKWCVEKLFLK
jgi:hypothetical protein